VVVRLELSGPVLRAFRREISPAAPCGFLFRPMSTRQEIYDRIRESSKNEVILEEMIRLGFWPQQEGAPENAADDIRRTGELERQLRALTTENSRLQNVDAIKKAARKKRMAESRQKQKETKERRLKEREERAAAWHEKKKTEIVYLGADVSNSLNQQDSDDVKLTTRSLPTVGSVVELAAAMNIPVSELRFLAFDRRTSTTTHYRRFGIAKKTGGIRTISAPMPRLKRAQEWILQNVLENVELHRAAHGFRRGRSIVTNAQPHVNSDVVINVDVQNFFPTVTFPRIRGVFKSLGYSGQLATILALICSEPDRDEVELDGRTFFVAKTERRLPQGAPSSPALTNIICRGLDARLDRTADKLGFRYTRYADDITFSGSGDALPEIGRALRRIEYIVSAEGFTLHPDKTRIQRKSSRQEVTGLVVNDGVSVKRDILRNFRALLFHIERDGPAGKSWGNSMHVMTSIEGFANFVAMVDSEKGAALQAKVRALHAQHGNQQQQYTERQRWKPPERVTVTPSEDTSAFENPSARKKPWWKFW
jgi:RNA-directed DNA polymerase